MTELITPPAERVYLHAPGGTPAVVQVPSNTIKVIAPAAPPIVIPDPEPFDFDALVAATLGV